MVQEIRRELPKIGGKKLYYMLSDKIHQVAKIGRDKFFMILNNNDLLIQGRGVMPVRPILIILLESGQILLKM